MAHPDPTRVMLRRCVAYAIDATLVVGAMAIVFFVTGDIEQVPNPVSVHRPKWWPAP